MRIKVLKFCIVFYVTTILCAVAWEKFVDGYIYDCTDPMFGYLLPDGWVGGNNFPVEVVPKVNSGRSMAMADQIKEGWSVTGLWCLWGSLFVSSLVTSFLLAAKPWPSDFKGQEKVPVPTA